MKIKKLLPEDVKGNLLGFKDYRKVIKPALKAMLTQHASQETSTRFIAISNYEYADIKGKKMGLLIAGDQTSAWLKIAKELLKENKKNVCIGECYVKIGSDGSNILVLQPEKGAAKKNLLKKQLEKSALKGSPFTVEIGTGGELEEDDPNEAVADEVELSDEAEANTSNRDAEIQPQIAALIKEIATGYKGDVLPIIDQIKARKGDESFVAPLETLLNKIDQLQELYENASEDLQKRLNANALQVFGLTANLEKVKAKNDELLTIQNPDLETIKERINTVLMPLKHQVDKSILNYKKRKADKIELKNLKNLLDEYIIIFSMISNLQRKKLDPNSKEELKELFLKIKNERLNYDVLFKLTEIQLDSKTEQYHSVLIDTVGKGLSSISKNAPDASDRQLCLENFEKNYLQAIQTISGNFEINEIYLSGSVNGGTTELNTKTNKVTISINKDENEDVKKAYIAHEIQHLIQYSKGQIGLWKSNQKGKEAGSPHLWLYDLNDEVEAYKVQFSINPKAVPPKLDGTMVSNINEIDFDYVIGLGYNLPTVSLSTNSTLEEIENALFNIGNTDTLPSELLKDDYEKTKGLKLSNLLNSFVNKENTKTFVDIFNLIYK